MGEPVKIYDLAKKMIQLSGLKLKDQNNPKGDIEIKITGLRPVAPGFFNKTKVLSAQLIKLGGHQILVIVGCRGIIELKIIPVPAFASGVTAIAECPSTLSNNAVCTNWVIVSIEKIDNV